MCFEQLTKFELVRKAQLRSGESLSSPKVGKHRLKKGTRVQVAEESGERLRIVDPVGGWLSRRDLRTVDESKQVNSRGGEELGQRTPIP